MIQVGQITKLYCALKENINLYQWIQDHAQLVPLIDIRKFVIFGVLSNFLSRVHCYPVLLSIHTGEAENDAISLKLLKYLNGMHHMDSLLVKFQLNHNQLMQALERANVDLIYK